MRAIVTGLILALFAGEASVSRARADGGTLRAWDRRGLCEIAVFTAPTPMVAGPVDISVLVLDSTSGQPVENAEVIVTATPTGRTGDALRHAATTTAATNKLMYAALFDLPETGSWDMEVSIDAQDQNATIHFTMEAGKPWPPWTALLPWICWPAVVVVLYGIHQWLVWRRAR